MFAQDPLRNPEPLIRRVYSYVAYRIGDGPEAEDVTSEVFERALRYRGSYDPRKGAPTTWLVGIARRCVDDALASRTASEPELADVPSSQDLEAETVQRLSLESAIARLDARDRELIDLRYGADLSARQIAQALETTPNAARVALHRALRRLRAVLAEESSGEIDQDLRVPVRQLEGS